MDSLISFFSNPVVIGIIGVLVIAIVIDRLVYRRRTRAWIAVARRTGLSCFDENGRRLGNRASRKGNSREADYVKGFQLRCLLNGYHRFVAMGEWSGFPILAADYRETRSSDNLLVSNRPTMTYNRTVFAAHKKKANLPRMLICRDGFISDELKWIKDDEEVEIEDDPDFSRTFKVYSSNPEKARRRLISRLRETLKQAGHSKGFHFETAGNYLAIHDGKNVPLKDLEANLNQLTEIARALQ